MKRTTELPRQGWSWDACVDVIAELDDLARCAQDPVFHGEGDVATHTRMVLDALEADPDYRALPEGEAAELWLTALLHDIAKPACARVEDGRITARGHARRGAIATRTILWRLGVPADARERVCTLIHYHLHPFWALERDDAELHARAVAVRASCHGLAILARADGCGRISNSDDDLVDSVGLYREWCDALAVGPGYAFPSERARFEYFRTPGRDPSYDPYDTHRSVVTITSGLPGAGKDTWLATHAPGLPVVSLDAVRDELGIGWDGNQGPVIAEARERARVLLRAGEDFAWCATNLSAQLRGQTIDLAAAYDARVRIVVLEASPADIAARNRERERPVAPSVIDRLLHRWECPDLTECHELIRVDTSA